MTVKEAKDGLGQRWNVPMELCSQMPLNPVGVPRTLIVNTVREKERDLTQSYDESQRTNWTLNNQLTKQKLHQNVDNTMIADRPRTVSLREKGRDLTQSCDKSPYNNRKIKNVTLQYKKTQPKRRGHKNVVHNHI